MLRLLFLDATLLAGLVIGSSLAFDWLLGLFLDHRLTRQRIGAAARGQRFLNLFCYTGVALFCPTCPALSPTSSKDAAARSASWLTSCRARATPGTCEASALTLRTTSAMLPAISHPC